MDDYNEFIANTGNFTAPADNAAPGYQEYVIDLEKTYHGTRILLEEISERNC